MADPAYRALLIGNSTFPSDPHNLQDLEGPVNDVARLRDALTDPEVGLFDQHQVRMLPERTMGDILQEMEGFFTTASHDDRLLLYYSGHGLLTEANQLLLCAQDTRTDLVKSTTVSAGAINMMIDESATRTTLIILDCCYSGAFKGGNLPQSLAGEGRFLLTSARSTQLANDADQRNGTSLFTQHLVEALESEAPDRDGDGYVGLDEVYEYVHGRLTAEGRQIPQRNFAGGGDVALARRPTAPPVEKGGPPVLDLSETEIDLRDVQPEAVLPDEHVVVINRGGGRLDWRVETDAGWLELQPDDDGFGIRLRPKPGVNHGDVLVEDRVTGATRTVRVHVEVAPPQHRPLTTRVRDAVRGVRREVWIGVALAALAGAALLVFLLVRDSEWDRTSDGRSAGPVEVVIPGNQLWTDTGVDVAAGDRIEISAQGEVFHSETNAAGPEGIFNRGDLLTPVPTFNHAALLGRVDTTSSPGSPFFVGRGTTVVAERDGRLFLGINDGGAGNNRGFFSTTVEVDRQ